MVAVALHLFRVGQLPTTFAYASTNPSVKVDAFGAQERVIAASEVDPIIFVFFFGICPPVPSPSREGQHQ